MDTAGASASTSSTTEGKVSSISEKNPAMDEDVIGDDDNSRLFLVIIKK